MPHAPLRSWFAAFALLLAALPASASSLRLWLDGGGAALELDQSREPPRLRLTAYGAKDCERTLPSPEGWLALEPNATPDGALLSLESYFAEPLAGCTLTIHRLSAGYVRVEPSAACKALLSTPACMSPDFDALYTPDDARFSGANAPAGESLKADFARADAALNRSWKALKAQRGAEGLGPLQDEQRRWLKAKLKDCGRLAEPSNRQACETAYTQARLAVLQDALGPAVARADTLGSGAPLRAQAIALVESQLARELTQPLRLQNAVVRQLGDWLLVTGALRSPEGRPLDFRRTPYAEAAAGGDLEDAAQLLLRRAGGSLTVVDRAIGARDVYWAGWVSQHAVPQALFESP